MLKKSYRDAAHHIDDQNNDAGNGIAAHKFGRTVHRTIKIGLTADVGAPRARFGFGDESGVQIGVNRELLAGHRVQREPRRDLGNASGAFSDHDEINDDQNQEHHQADGVIAAHQKIAEGFDHLARCPRAGVALQQHNARRRDIQRQAQQRGQQQHRGEH